MEWTTLASYLSVAPLEQMHDEGVDSPLRITHSPGETIGAYVAWNGSRIGLAWSDDVDGQRDVYAQEFDSEGQALGAANNLSASVQDSSIPAIRAAGGSFLISWNDYVITLGEAHSSIESSVARFARLGGND